MLLFFKLSFKNELDILLEFFESTILYSEHFPVSFAVLRNSALRGCITCGENAVSYLTEATTVRDTGCSSWADLTLQCL